MSVELIERIAKLEEQNEHFEIRTKEIEDKLDTLITKVNEGLNELNRFKGFLGGITFLAGCVVTFLNTVGLDWLKK